MRYIRSPRRVERVGDEAVGGQVGAAEVAAGQLDAGQIQLTGDTDGTGRSRASST